MKKLCSLAFLMLLSASVSFAQVSLNMNLLDRWDDNTLPIRFGTAFNDIWGYVDGAGNEYALIGAIEGVYVFNVSTTDGESSATHPEEVGYISGGGQSLWRDIKTYQNFAYAVADEGAEGLIIIDMNNAPTSVSLALQTTAFFNRAHNIYIDEAAARLYVAGSNSHGSGLIVLDISTPDAPVEISDTNLPGGYVHDVFVRGDTAYCSHGNSGLYVYDYDIANSPQFLGSLTSYPEQGYNHSSWLTADGDHLVFADETKDRGLKIADVSSLNAISVGASNVFRSALEGPSATNSVAHNPFIVGDSVYISYYHDGVQVFDISDPNNVTNVAYYDTWPNNTNYSGWDGCWGVYPFLPSGNIIASDQLNGLYVLELASNPVPVELMSFEGTIRYEQHYLEWSTAIEKNSKEFEVQRSRNGIDFESIGKVDAAGEAYSRKDYQFIDATPLPGDNYYRLKMIDEDGTFEYSSILHLLQKEYSGHVLRVYPNVLNGAGQVYIDHDLSPQQEQVLEIRLLDMSGREIAPSLRSSSNGRQVLVDIPVLPTGGYLLELRGERTNHVERITVHR